MMNEYFHEFSRLFVFFFFFLVMNLKSYTFRILKDFHLRLRAKTIQMFDFFLCFRQKLRESPSSTITREKSRAHNLIVVV